MQIFHNLNVDFLGKRKIFYFVSLSLFLIGWISVIFRGFNFGIDFKGGSEIVLQFDNKIEISEIRKDIENIGLGNVEVRTFGGETGALIRTELQEIPSNVYPKVVQNIENEINKIIPDVPFTVAGKTSNSITYSFPNPDTTNLVSEQLSAAGYQTSNYRINRKIG